VVVVSIHSDIIIAFYINIWYINYACTTELVLTSRKIDISIFLG
jgi:hypothetical protein